MLINTHDKSGTVCTVGQACAAPAIWIAEESSCVFHNFFAFALRVCSSSAVGSFDVFARNITGFTLYFNFYPCFTRSKNFDLGRLADSNYRIGCAGFAGSYHKLFCAGAADDIGIWTGSSTGFCVDITSLCITNLVANLDFYPFCSAGKNLHLISFVNDFDTFGAGGLSGTDM